MEGTVEGERPKLWGASRADIAAHWECEEAPAH